jgi:hypothetical protein
MDFQLWFYGLSWRRGTPRYVWSLTNALCRAEGPAMELFLDPPAKSPRAIRLVYWRYRFTTPAEREQTGHVWHREEVASVKAMRCDVVARRKS